MMPRRAQIIVFVALLVVLALIVYHYWGGPSTVPVVSSDIKYQPLAVENPSLRLDMLARIRKFEYAGAHRNIFSPSLPPPPPPKVEPGKLAALTPPPPPPLDVPVKFFGYAADPRTGFRRAFFTNGEDVFIVAEGETLLSRFRLLRIGNNTADLEEIASGRRATLVLEWPESPPA